MSCSASSSAWPPRKSSILDDEALTAGRALLEKAYARRDESFGNARTVRKALDRAVKNLSSRVAYDDSVTEDELMTIKAEDINTIELEDIL